MLLRLGDYILATGSHQEALSALLNKHTSWKGLRVKTWPRGHATKFPGGLEHMRYDDAMKHWITGSTKPYIFHMSWTRNKDEKIRYYKQMGEWYTKDECLEDCCLTMPNITCFYRDMASAVYCGHAKAKLNKPSFWKSQKEIDDMMNTSQ